MRRLTMSLNTPPPLLSSPPVDAVVNATLATLLARGSGEHGTAHVSECFSMGAEVLHLLPWCGRQRAVCPSSELFFKAPLVFSRLGRDADHVRHRRVIEDMRAAFCLLERLIWLPGIASRPLIREAILGRALVGSQCGGGLWATEDLQRHRQRWPDESCRALSFPTGRVSGKFCT